MAKDDSVGQDTQCLLYVIEAQEDTTSISCNCFLCSKDRSTFLMRDVSLFQDLFNRSVSYASVTVRLPWISPTSFVYKPHFNESERASRLTIALKMRVSHLITTIPPSKRCSLIKVSSLSLASSTSSLVKGMSRRESSFSRDSVATCASKLSKIGGSREEIECLLLIIIIVFGSHKRKRLPQSSSLMVRAHSSHFESLTRSKKNEFPQFQH